MGWDGLLLDRPLGFFASRTLAVWYGFRLGSGLVLRGSQHGYWVDFRGHAVNFFCMHLLSKYLPNNRVESAWLVFSSDFRGHAVNFFFRL